ncbi:MAG: hypothetical protein ABIG95_02810 [Candidatus Woesearchaeota archaeon]
MFDPKFHLLRFAEICKNSKEFQGDGWGVCYLDNDWKLYRSVKPIWEEQNIFEHLPETGLLVAHARSAFKDKGAVMEFSQPFLDNGVVFVFNGELRGMRLKVPGKIGSEKIFNIFKRYLTEGVEAALGKTQRELEANAKYVRALNVGVINREGGAVLCRFGEQPEYFTLHYYEGDDLKIVCSDPYKPYEFQEFTDGEIRLL